MGRASIFNIFVSIYQTTRRHASQNNNVTILTPVTADKIKQFLIFCTQLSPPCRKTLAHFVITRQKGKSWVGGGGIGGGGDVRARKFLERRHSENGLREILSSQT
jgi:hypothetical protein